MKRRSILIVTVIMMIVVLAGCGKSDEQKARDEIMSHMSADEKAAIAADQQAIADYEAEKQAQADAIANETPIDYSEVLEERELGGIVFNNSSLVNISVSVLLPGDEYLYNGKGYENPGSNGMYYYGQNHPAFYAMFSAVPVKNVSSDAEDLGNYLIYMQPDTLNSGMNLLIVANKDADFAVQINFNSYDRNDEHYNNEAIAVLNKNYEHIKEQLIGDNSYDVSEEALGDAEPEIFGTYTCDNGNNLEIGYGDDGFSIFISGSNEYKGTLTWLADDLYESRTGEVWLQTQLTEDGITIRSSYLPLEGSYIRN